MEEREKEVIQADCRLTEHKADMIFTVVSVLAKLGVWKGDREFYAPRWQLATLWEGSEVQPKGYEGQPKGFESGLGRMNKQGNGISPHSSSLAVRQKKCDKLSSICCLKEVIC